MARSTSFSSLTFLSFLLLMSTRLLLTSAIEIQSFYPYGARANDVTMMDGDETSSDEIKLAETFNIYNQSFTSCYVNTNGLISFGSPVPDYRSDRAMPLGETVAAAFFADIDTTGGNGRVYYRNTSDATLLQQAGIAVQLHFSDHDDYMPTLVFIATWDRVGYYPSRGDKRNTFQIVLSTDGTRTFAFYYYLDSGVQWFKSEGKSAGVYPDLPPQAGFENGQGGTFYLLKGSGRDGDFFAKSNCDTPGAWMFQIGRLDSGNVVEPDPVIGDEQIFVPENAVESCFQSEDVCSPHSECTDHATGFCCACVEPYYGNGYACLENDKPQTVNGGMTGSINGVTLTGNLLHTYVETKRGRTHSSISRLPETLVPSMQILNSVGGIVGWLFALKQEGDSGKNGFQYTGGRFNRTARVTFQSPNRTDQVVRIVQTAEGHATETNIRMHTRIDGTMPDISPDADVVVNDYTEEYEKIDTGVIRSFTTRSYKVNGTEHSYTWENTISFDECVDGSMPSTGTGTGTDRVRLEVSRTYFNYSPSHKAYRFGMTSKVVSSSDDDPCSTANNQCHANAQCSPQGDSFRCSCKPGFRGDGFRCDDYDECQRRPCDANARCMNLPGTFRCECLPGYTGNGRECQRDEQLCGSARCDDNARCVYIDDATQPSCQCNPGFRGNGVQCSPQEMTCQDADICGDNAQCVYDDILREYACECMDDFSGDGVTCERVDQGCDACHQAAECVLEPMRNRYTCRCREGYTGDGRSCSVIETCGRCDRYARCQFVEDTSSYRCVCAYGFEGDGMTCRRADCKGREDMCAKDGGICWENRETKEHICRCNYGYRGDGYRCEKLTCDEYNFCSSDAKCQLGDDGYVCQCKEGFYGDGRRCSRTERTCNRYDICDANAQCVETGQGFVCQCKNGFEGDGTTCRQAARSCDEYNFCDPNAQCMPGPDGYECQCNDGYYGDGRRCRSTERTCNEQNFCDENAKCVSGENGWECKCNDGFYGDGRRCRSTARTCDVYNFCDRNAACVRGVAQYECRCKPGYRGDGRRCQRTEETTCNVVNDCDVNARCRSVGETYKCLCNPGYEGDGKRCTQREEPPCNQVDNCDSNAECMYDPDTTSYRCACKRGYEGDGFVCQAREVVDCSRNRRMCSSSADCVRGIANTYTCVCRPGYQGDGTRCTPVRRDGGFLVYTQGHKLMRISTEPQPGDHGEQLVYEPGQLAVGIDTDCSSGHIYWTDAANGAIRRSSFNGSDVETVISGLKSPEGIAVDFVASNMFFTDSELDVIQVAKLDGSSVKTIVDVDLENPRAIVLDITKGTIYWTDWNRDKPQIEKINMDGSDRKIFVEENLRLPNGLTFDTYSQQLCWCDAGSLTIECIREDGRGRRVIYDGASRPFDLTILNNVIYWTDWKRKNIPNVDKNGNEANDPLTLAVGGHGRLYGITAVRDQCPRARNSCGLNNGGCSYLCLPTPNGGRTCACPDGVDPRLCQQ